MALRSVAALPGLDAAERSRKGQALADWLGSSRLIRPPAQPLSDAELRKIAEDQADQMDRIIRAVLDGLGLTDEQWERGRDIAVEALRAATTEGWEPL